MSHDPHRPESSETTDTPMHPGTALAELMKARGLSANKLALALRVPSGRITSIVNKKRGISAETAMRLARYFSTDEEYWMNLQSRYELAEARVRHGARIAGEVPAGGAYDADALDSSEMDLNAREGFVSGVGRLGFVYAHRGSLAEAESHYRKMLDMSQHLNNETGMAADHANLGRLYARQGKHAQAREQWDEALALYEKAGDGESAQVINRWLAELASGQTARKAGA